MRVCVLRGIIISVFSLQGGMCQVMFTNPIEIVKIRLQVATPSHPHTLTPSHPHTGCRGDGRDVQARGGARDA